MTEFLTYVSDISAHFTLRSAIDVGIVALVFFWLFSVLRGTTAITLLRGIAIVYGVGFLVSAALQLSMVGWLLRNSLPAMLVAVPIVFQPELRRVLQQTGRGMRFWRPSLPSHTAQATADAVAQAARWLSQRRLGALIVLEREIGLQEYTEHGVPLDAILTPDLLAGLFNPTSPFHDGAAIIHRGRIAACRCVLPLSENMDDGLGVGLRHRAALGISERSDAIALAVSEERGTSRLR